MSITHVAERPGCRPWRRCLRFSVRGLIVVVVLIGGCFGWLARGARIQREAVAAIWKDSRSVWYDWEWSNGRRILACSPFFGPPDKGDYLGNLHVSLRMSHCSVMSSPPVAGCTELFRRRVIE